MAAYNPNTFWGLSTFVGGESEDIKYGGKYMYDYGRHIDVRSSPYKFTVLPGMQKTSGSVVTDLILDMTQVPNGNRYAVGDSGNVYLVTTANVWSRQFNIGEKSGGGIYYRPDADCIYITGQTKIARIKTVSTNPIPQVNWFANGISSSSECYMTGGPNTYPVPLVTSESTTNMRTFVSDIEPLYQIGVKIIVKGTGDWTLTLHDDANNLLGTSTVSNANLINGGVNYFVFSTPIRLSVSPNNITFTSSGGRTYHFHLTSTVADGTIATTTANSLQDCDMELWATALVPTINGLHTIYQFAQYTLFGNEKYIAAYEPLQDNPTTADFLRHRITMPPGYESNGFAQISLYCAATFEQRSSDTTQDFQAGKMLLWDGIQTTYNNWFDIPEGSPEAIYSTKNVLYLIADGALYTSTGDQPVKLRTFRNTSTTYSNTANATHVNPHMMTVRNGVLLMGYPSLTTNQSLEHAMYEYGSISSQYPVSWTTSYTMSTGSILNNGTNNLHIGFIANFGDTLYMSWRDDSQGPNTYGVDMINSSSPPASDFQIQLLYFDDGTPYKEKLAKKALSIWNSLPVGVSIDMKYMLNDDGVWHYMTDDGTLPTTTGVVATVTIPQQFISMRVGLSGTITGSVSPECLGLYLLHDPEPTRSELSQ